MVIITPPWRGNRLNSVTPNLDDSGVKPQSDILLLYFLMKARQRYLAFKIVVKSFPCQEYERVKYKSPLTYPPHKPLRLLLRRHLTLKLRFPE